MRRPIIAVYAGSFDPPTLGHEDVSIRALNFCDRLIVAVGVNPSKKGFLSTEERLNLLRDIFTPHSQIEVTSFDGLLVDFCRGAGARVIVRGLRAVSDFEYELGMAQANRDQNAGIETVFLPTKAEHSFVSSTYVKAFASHKGKLDRYVRPSVEKMVRSKFGGT